MMNSLKLLASEDLESLAGQQSASAFGSGSDLSDMLFDSPNERSESESRNAKISMQIPWKYLHVRSLSKNLHLAAMSSLKGEVIELGNRLKCLQMDKEMLEKQVAKQQVEKLRMQSDVEDRYEQQMTRYEDRITELHSIIAELRKKTDQRQISIIHEEDELEESDDIQSNRSVEADSVTDNALSCSHHANAADVGCDLNLELSRVVSELESAIDQHCKLTVSSQGGDGKVTRLVSSLSGSEDKTDQVSPLDGCDDDRHLSLNESEELERRIYDLELCQQSLQQRNELLQSEVKLLHAQLEGIRNERDQYKRKMEEVQQSNESTETLPSSLASSIQNKTFPLPKDKSESLPQSTTIPAPVTKVAELKKLKTGKHDRSVLGAEISYLGLPNAKVAEHLAQSMQENSIIQELLQSVQRGSQTESGSCNLAIGKIRELEIEHERLQSRVDHLRAQNDFLSLTLAESKNNCDQLTVLLGRYESNNTALQMSLSYSDQALEVYDVIVKLLDSEQALLLAKCRATGLGSFEEQNLTFVLQNARLSRRAVESVARQLLAHLEHGGAVVNRTGVVSPWEDLSSTSRNASSSTSSDDAELTKLDEHRLREHLRQLMADRTVVKLTISELESLHLDPFISDLKLNPDAQRLDLENAVLMQELMAMKEEKSELKARNYFLEKEKAARELNLSTNKSLELQSSSNVVLSPTDVIQSSETFDEATAQGVSSITTDLQKISSNLMGAWDGCNVHDKLPNDSAKMALKLSEGLKREARLRVQVQELTASLEKLSKNADMRQQQSAGFVNELKKANSALVYAFEKAKKKYLDKMKKMEVHLQRTTERYETQMELMRQKLMMMEKELQRQSSPGLSLL